MVKNKYGFPQLYLLTSRGCLTVQHMISSDTPCIAIPENQVNFKSNLSNYILDKPRMSWTRFNKNRQLFLYKSSV
jgi:hypothetical protein